MTLIDNVIAPPGASEQELDDLYDAAVDRLDELAVDGARSLDEPLVEPRPTTRCCPRCARPWAPPTTADAVEAAKELILDGDIFQVVLAQRFDLEGGSAPMPSTSTACCAR